MGFRKGFLGGAKRRGKLDLASRMTEDDSGYQANAPRVARWQGLTATDVPTARFTPAPRVKPTVVTVSPHPAVRFIPTYSVDIFNLLMIKMNLGMKNCAAGECFGIFLGYLICYIFNLN
jgi:hypothetical protein